MFDTARIRRCKQAAVVWRVLNRPIYIPENDAEVVALLVTRDTAKLATLLLRRISLGSDSAAALLGYLEFMGAISGEFNPNAAISLCADSAKRGYPYAQYVIAWAHWEIGKKADGIRWMKRAAVESKFLPAWVDLGMMVAILGANRRVIRAGVTYILAAHKMGHAAALLAICSVGLGGRLGLAWRLGCAIAFPFCLLRAVLFWRCQPFSERSLVTLKNPKVPFFVPKRRC